MIFASTTANTTRHAFEFPSKLKASIYLSLALMCIGHSQAATILGVIADKLGNPVADGVIYATPLDAPTPAAKASDLETINIGQENYLFLPYVSVVRAGSSGRFSNRDPHDHHIKSFSPAKSIDLRLANKKDDVTNIVFDKTGEIALVCYFHDWMRGFVYVVDTPYFAKTDKLGNAFLNGLPAGKYEVRAWVPKMLSDPLLQTVQVTATDGNAVKFQLNFVPAAAPRPVLPKKKSETPAASSYTPPER